MDIISYLIDALSGLNVRVASLVPSNRPLPLIVVSREGGGSEYFGFDYPLISIRVYHKTDAEAYALALRVKDILFELEDNPELTEVNLSGLVCISSSPDEVIYQLTYYLSTY